MSATPDRPIDWSSIVNSPSAPRAKVVSLITVLALVLVACGVDVSSERDAIVTSGPDVVGVDPNTTDPNVTTTTLQLLPPGVRDINGDDGSEINKVIANAVVDVEEFWSEQFPALYGSPYKPLSGGLWALDSKTDPKGIPCGGATIEESLNNAYYCPPADAVAWDQEFLIPELEDQFGDFTVAVVVAHEWGHAIQARAEVDEPTIVTELQADCFAGAWVRHVQLDRPTRFAVSTEDLDLALAGFLALKDAPGASSDDPAAHGSGFDRVAAVQDGYENSAETCVGYKVGAPDAYQFPFNDENDYANEGNMPLHAVNGEDGIDSAAFVSLEDYWVETFPTISGGKAWQPLDAQPFAPDDPPSCNGKEVTQYKLFLCVPDGYVGFDDEVAMPEAYKLGDFAVGHLFGTQYGLAVQHQLGIDVTDEVLSTLRGDCFAGAWGGALLPGADGGSQIDNPLVLSPGDLDEAVAVMLSFRSESDRERQGPGFDRVRAFRAGVIQGPGACAALQGPG